MEECVTSTGQPSENDKSMKQSHPSGPLSCRWTTWHVCQRLNWPNMFIKSVLCDEHHLCCTLSRSTWFASSLCPCSASNTPSHLAHSPSGLGKMPILLLLSTPTLPAVLKLTMHSMGSASL